MTNLNADLSIYDICKYGKASECKNLDEIFSELNRRYGFNYQVTDNDSIDQYDYLLRFLIANKKLRKDREFYICLNFLSQFPEELAKHLWPENTEEIVVYFLKNPVSK